MKETVAPPECIISVNGRRCPTVVIAVLAGWQRGQREVLQLVVAIPRNMTHGLR